MNDDRQMCVLFVKKGNMNTLAKCNMHMLMHIYVSSLIIYIYIYYYSVVGVVADGDNDAFFAWRAQVLNSQKTHKIDKNQRQVVSSARHCFGCSFLNFALLASYLHTRYIYLQTIYFYIYNLHNGNLNPNNTRSRRWWVTEPCQCGALSRRCYAN